MKKKEIAIAKPKRKLGVLTVGMGTVLMAGGQKPKRGRQQGIRKWQRAIFNYF